MIDTATPFFPMPGITAEIERSLVNQLGASSEFLDHIVISGPRGVGKSYFVQIAKEYLWHNEAKEFDCEAISKEDLENWKSFEVKDKKLIILENLENFPPEETRALSSLLKKVRVVATTRDKLPKEFKDQFTIGIEVPPLSNRRDDIFYFIAKKYPSLLLTNINLICLYAYHWPGNFRELNKVLQRLSADRNLPTDFEISEDNLHKLFLTLYKNGLQAPDLLLTHNTCFSHILPMEDGGGLVGELAELKFQHNDSSTDIEAFIDPIFSNTVLDGNEIRWIFKCFFELIYGRGATFHDQNIFELQPFTAESYEIIEQAQKDVYQWNLGDSYSSDYDFNYSYFQHFSKSLKQEELDAAISYLDACAASCPAACPLAVQGDFLTLQEAVTETGMNVRQLLEIAQRDADLLELRFGVERKNIVQPVSSAEMAILAGDSEYLAIPIENIGSLIDRGETTTQIFRFPRRPPFSLWLKEFDDALSKSGFESDEVRTISPSKITLGQIYVIREQVEKHIHKLPEKHPAPEVNNPYKTESPNYFISGGDYWKVRFNEGKETMIRKSSAIDTLLEYLKVRNVKLSRDDVYLRLNALQTDNQSPLVDYTDDLSNISHSQLNTDHTKVLSKAEKKIFEERLGDLIDRIKFFGDQGKHEEVEVKQDEFDKIVAHLGKMYSAKVSPKTGEIFDYNRTARPRNLGTENTQKHLGRAVVALKNVPGLSEHLKNFLIKNKDIYQPPQDFPEWEITP